MLVLLAVQAGLLVGVPAHGALAQVGFNASIMSDFRYRGFTLSDGRPAIDLSVSYDHPSGAYFAISGIGAATAHDGAQLLGYQAYLGYARRTKSGASLDIGVNHTRISEFAWPRERLEYSEIYAGVSWKDVSAHVYYSPNYLGDHWSAVYLDLSGTVRLDPNWRLFGHFGVLEPVAGRSGWETPNTQYDLRAGLAVRRDPVELQLAWSRFGPDADYPPGQSQGHNAVVALLSYSF